MPDKIVSRDTRDTRDAHTDNNVLIGIALAAVVALLLLFGARFFAGESDVNTAPPTTEAPATTNPQPAQ
jgi:hypothetical protein